MPRAKAPKLNLPQYMQFVSLSHRTSNAGLWQACYSATPGETIRFANIMSPPADVGLVLQVTGSGLRLINIRVLGDYIRQGSWASSQKDVLEARWASVQSDPAYQWLAKQDGWNNAFRSLDLLAKRKPASKYAHPLARFRLVSVIAHNVGWYLFARRDGREPHVLSKAEVRKALSQVNALLRFLERDRELLAVGDHFAVSQALGPLKTALESAAAPGRYNDRSDATLLERRFIQRVVKHLNEAFGGTSPVLAEHIASMAGYVVPGTTLQRIIDDAKKTASDEQSD